MEVPELKELSEYFLSLKSCNKLDDENADIIKTSLMSLNSQTKEKSFFAFTKILITLYETLETNLTSSPTYSEKDGDRMKIIMNYTLENMHKTISIREVSRGIGYTPEAFCRFFKHRTRKTFIQYLNELRINEACNKLLNMKEKNISEIAFESGFNNVTHFNRTFKKLKGLAPLKYKASINNNYNTLGDL
jgi:AraC-like DNA-binding protein